MQFLNHVHSVWHPTPQGFRPTSALKYLGILGFQISWSYDAISQRREDVVAKKDTDRTTSMNPLSQSVLIRAWILASPAPAPAFVLVHEQPANHFNIHAYRMNFDSLGQALWALWGDTDRNFKCTVYSEPSRWISRLIYRKSFRDLRRNFPEIALYIN